MKITKIIEECQIAMIKTLDKFERDENLKKKIPWDFKIENPVDVFAMNLKKKKNRLLEDNKFYNILEESYIPILYIHTKNGIIPIDRLKSLYIEELLNNLSVKLNKEWDTLHLCNIARSSEIFNENQYNEKLKEKFNNFNFKNLENGKSHKKFYYKTKDGKYLIKCLIELDIE